MLRNLKKLRTEKGLSQQALADMLIVSQQTIYKYEKLGVEPDIKTLEKMSEIFGTSIDYIVGNTDCPIKAASKNADDIISEEELKLIKKYRRLPDMVRSGILNIINGCDSQNTE